MALPPLTPEQRQAALDKAAASRRERAEVKNRLKNSGASIVDVLARGPDQRGHRQDAGRRPAPGDARARQGPRPAGDGAARHRREPPGARARAPSRSPRSSASSPRVTDRHPDADAATRPRVSSCSPARPPSARAPSPPTIRDDHPEVWISVSATTRPPRPGEEDGVHYWFVSDDGVRPDGRRGRAARVGRRARRRPLRHPAPARSSRRWPPAGRRCWRSTSRAPGRCARRCRRRCSSSWSRRRGRSWSAGWSAAAPRPRPSGSAGWPPRGRAGRRGRVRRDHRQPRSSRCGRGVGSLDEVRARP